MSIKNQANFWLKNICDFNIIDHNFSDEIIEGFAAFSSLMRDIYEDYKSFETSTKGNNITKIGIAENDLENYHNLTETIDCLYKVAAVSELNIFGKETYLKVNKAILKTKFKKQTAFAFSMLEKHGFYFLFYKNENKVRDYKQCNSFCVHYENNNNLLPAIKLFADTLAKQSIKTDLSNGVEFYMTDYETVFTGATTTPQKQNILNLLGEYAPLWLEFIENTDRLNLAFELTINPYVFPNWTVKILNGKKTVCTFFIGGKYEGLYSDKLVIRLPVPFETAKEFILKRETLPESINNCISNWHCINCGKCQNQINIEIINDIPLCNLKYSNFTTEDSRILYFAVTKDSEISTINEILSSQLRK